MLFRLLDQEKGLQVAGFIRRVHVALDEDLLAVEDFHIGVENVRVAFDDDKSLVRNVFGEVESAIASGTSVRYP